MMIESNPEILSGAPCIAGIPRTIRNWKSARVHTRHFHRNWLPLVATA